MRATGPAGGAWPPQPVAGLRRGRLVWILAPLSAFGPLSIDMYLPALPSMARDLDASASVAQYTDEPRSIVPVMTTLVDLAVMVFETNGLTQW